jgi:hypothetical protein
MTVHDFSASKYERTENVLHLWFPLPIEVADGEAMQALCDEVLTKRISPCPTKPYLLANYSNLCIHPAMARGQVDFGRRIKENVLGIFRYGMPPDWTGIAVSIGSMRFAAKANIFPNEASAREAIRKAKEAAGRQK